MVRSELHFCFLASYCRDHTDTVPRLCYIIVDQIFSFSGYYYQSVWSILNVVRSELDFCFLASYCRDHTDTVPWLCYIVVDQIFSF